MSNKEEILKELRTIRMQIALTPVSDAKDELVIFAEKLHNDYKASLFEEKMQEKRKGR